jgi:hypothetical protein
MVQIKLIIEVVLPIISMQRIIESLEQVVFVIRKLILVQLWKMLY